MLRRPAKDLPLRVKLCRQPSTVLLHHPAEVTISAGILLLVAFRSTILPSLMAPTRVAPLRLNVNNLIMGFHSIGEFRSNYYICHYTKNYYYYLLKNIFNV